MRTRNNRAGRRVMMCAALVLGISIIGGPASAASGTAKPLSKTMTEEAGPDAVNWPSMTIFEEEVVCESDTMRIAIAIHRGDTRTYSLISPDTAHVVDSAVLAVDQYAILEDPDTMDPGEQRVWGIMANSPDGPDKVFGGGQVTLSANTGCRAGGPLRGLDLDRALDGFGIDLSQYERVLSYNNSL